MSQLAVQVALLLIIAQTTLPQQSPIKVPASGQPPVSSSRETIDRKPNKEEEAEAKRVEKAAKDEQLHRLVDRALAFKDSVATSVTMANLADVIWPADESYARDLFSKAYELTVFKEGKISYSSLPQVVSWAGVRRTIIRRIAQHDSAWGKQLLEKEFSSDRDKLISNSTKAWTYTDLALDAVADNPSQAVDYAKQGMSNEVSPNLLELLFRLRDKDHAAADGLYLQALDQMRQQQTVAANDLALFGTYVFTSPKIPSAMAIANPVMVTNVIVNGIFVIDLTGDRSNAGPNATRGYLSVAAAILTRQVTDKAQQTLYYAYAKELLPKALTYDPDDAPLFIQSMNQRVSDVPASFKDDSAYANLYSNDGALTEEQIASLPDASKRNARYLIMVDDLLRRKNFEGARRVADKITDSSARDSLRGVVDFGEGVDALDHGQAMRAEELAGKLQGGIESAVLWLGAASARFVRGQKAESIQAINASLAVSRDLDDAHKPFLLLAAAAQFGRLDPFMGRMTLNEAIKAFNKANPLQLARVNWEVEVTAGATVRRFPVKARNVNFGLDSSLPEFMKADREETINAILNIEPEEILGQALTTVAASILRSKATSEGVNISQPSR